MSVLKGDVMKDKWNVKSAESMVTRNCDVKMKHGVYYVLKNTAGNRTLGAIDYLNNYTNTRVNIVKNEVFKDL